MLIYITFSELLIKIDVFNKLFKPSADFSREATLNQLMAQTSTLSDCKHSSTRGECPRSSLKMAATTGLLGQLHNKRRSKHRM